MTTELSVRQWRLLAEVRRATDGETSLQRSGEVTVRGLCAHDVTIKSLQRRGLVTLGGYCAEVDGDGHTARDDSPWYAITDLGRAVLLAQDDADATGGAAPGLAATVVAQAATLAAQAEELGRLRAALAEAEVRADNCLRCGEAAEEECERLREIVEGRTAPPADAEVAAHIATGGRWLVSSRGEDNGPWSMPAVSVEHGQRTARDHRRLDAPWRWHALDVDGRPCAWPVAAREGASE